MITSRSLSNREGLMRSLVRVTTALISEASCGNPLRNWVDSDSTKIHAPSLAPGKLDVV